MMKNLYQLEKQKIKGRKIGLITAIVLVIQFAWLLTCFRPPVTEADLANGYNMVLIDLPVLNTIFFPLLIAMIASRICEIEHKGNNLKLLYTMIDRKKLFDIKFLIGVRYIMFIALVQFILIFAVAKIVGFTTAPPLFHCVWISMSCILMNIALFLMQEIGSFWFENQMIPLAIGLFGSFFGIMSLFIQEVREISLWASYLMLGTINMNWDSETGITTYYELPIPWWKILGIIVAILLFYTVGKWLVMSKKEV